MTKKTSHQDLEKKIDELKQKIAAQQLHLDIGDAIYNAMSDGIVIIEPTNRTIRGVNNVALRTLGYTSKDELIGQSCCACFCTKDISDCPIDIENHTAGYSEKEVKTKDGRIVPIMKKAEIITNVNGKKYIMETFRDITQKKQLEGRLSDAEQLAYLGEVAADILHDLNGPLTGARGGLQLMESTINKLPDSKEKQKILRMLGTSNNAYDVINSIVRSILIYTREHYEDMPTNVYLHNTLNTTLDILKFDKFYKEHVKHFSKFDISDVPPVKGLYSNFYKIFFNLLQNSVHSIQDAQKNGVIERNQPNKLSLLLEHIKDKNCIHFQIEDRGMGIEPENLTKIFTPHYTTKPVDKGTGLGLSSVQKIVKQLNGEIDVESKVEYGTKFDIKFPLKK